MQVTSMNVETFTNMFVAGAQSLEAQRDWINKLNVFPVPDGDTGTNMTMTIMSAVKEAEALDHPSFEMLSKAISSGSLRGARGNSGVILSQLFRGFCKVIRKYEVLDVMILTEANQKAVETAYKAVMKPKEGTILTVARGMAERSLELCEETDDIVLYLQELIKYGDEVLEQTPEMLPVLKEAGVVDSGGQGLMEIMRGAYEALIGNQGGERLRQAKAQEEEERTQAEEEIRFAYCTEFLIMTEKAMDEEEERAYKAYLEGMGDSIVVVADDDIVKTHVHTNDPGLVLQKALTFGSLCNIKIDNMRLEHEEKIAEENGVELDTKYTPEHLHSSASKGYTADVEAAAAQAEAAEPAIPHKDFGFIAVSIGEGMNEILLGLGVDYIVSGGQTMNPSTEDILDAIAQVNADHIFVMPNNKNIVMAANQAAALTQDKQVLVVPTQNVPQGISAMVNFIPSLSAEENADTMAEEMALVKTGEVTYAVRDTQMDGFTIHENDYMGIGDDGILAAGGDLAEVTTQMVDAMVDEDSAIISIYYGVDTDPEQAEALGAQLGEKYPEVEVEVNEGSQPIYYYVVSVE